MKSIAVLALFIVVALGHPDGSDDQYDSKYDDFDVDSIISNPRLLKGYLECFLGKSSCTPEGKNFKKVIPEAIATKCGKCTPKQRVLIRKVIKAVQEKLPEQWKELAKLYDQEGKYKESLQKFLEESE